MLDSCLLTFRDQISHFCIALQIDYKRHFTNMCIILFIITYARCIGFASRFHSLQKQFCLIWHQLKRCEVNLRWRHFSLSDVICNLHSCELITNTKFDRLLSIYLVAVLISSQLPCNFPCTCLLSGSVYIFADTMFRCCFGEDISMCHLIEPWFASSEQDPNYHISFENYLPPLPLSAHTHTPTYFIV